MKKEEKIILINELLIERFGVPQKNNKLPEPEEMLVGTILSQNTNDRNSYKAYLNLRKKYSSLEEVKNARREEIEDVIRVAGLGKQKSAAIKSFLEQVYNDRRKVSLEHIKGLDNKSILEELTRYKGVGFKTASCVLLFSLGRNICPVDTHVNRTVNRIGLVNENSPDKTFFKLNENFPEGIAHSFHTNLIRLGREICRPKKPYCGSCPLFDICEFADKNPGDVITPKENKFMLLDNI